MRRGHRDRVSLVAISRNLQARRMGIAGHQFVNADCSRFTPANAVSQSQGEQYDDSGECAQTTFNSHARVPFLRSVLSGFEGEEVCLAAAT